MVDVVFPPIVKGTFTHRKVSKTFSEVTAEQRGVSTPAVAVNKNNIEYGHERFIRLAGLNPVIRHYDYSKEKSHTVTPTVVGAQLVYSSKMNDYDDSTYLLDDAAGIWSEDSNYVQWDLGSSATRYIYALASSDASTTRAIVKVSPDGTNWTYVVDVANGVQAKIMKATFRYVRFTYANSESVTHYVSLRELNVFDVADTTKTVSGSGSTVIESSFSPEVKHMVIVEADSLVNYYVYDISNVKITVEDYFEEVK